MTRDGLLAAIGLFEEAIRVGATIVRIGSTLFEGLRG